MGDSRDWTGSRLGPYHLDQRYQDLDEPGGQLYAAHHVDTGRPALVLVPEAGDRWAPRSDWSARVTSQVEPPFLATELEHPPPAEADALSDVDLAFIRLAGGIAAVEDREDANADFTQPPRPRPDDRREARRPSWSHVRTGVLVTGALLLMATVLWPRILGSPEQATTMSTASLTEPTSWIDKQNSHSAVGYPMPDVAFPEQTRPPCQDGEVEIRGGCWMTLERRAPCAKGTAEYQGKCYAPVRKQAPEPSSVKP